jgi:predicted nucleic acid-binding protein
MTPEEKSSPKQNLILDSNIIEYASNKYCSVELNPYLSDLLKRGFGFAISDITIFELLKGASVKKENEMLQILNNFQRYYLTENVLTAASQIETLYKMESVDPKQMGYGDMFIAATSILTGSLILTANSRDFPSPFFQEVERLPLIYNERKNRARCILISILSPDINMINQRFSERPQK